MICAITLIDVGEDQWMYRLQYDKLFFERTYDLPFEEMSVLEKERFVAEMFSMAFTHDRMTKLDQRPAEFLEEIVDGMTKGSYDLDDEEEDDEDDEDEQ